MNIALAFKKFALLISFLLLGFSGFSQTIQVNGYTVCPNQPAIITPTWNNVGGITYTLFCPPNCQPFPNSSGVLPNSGSFSVSCSNTIVSQVIFTLCGNGTGASGAVSSCANIYVNINPPAPLSITNANNGFYCPGQTAVFTAATGGTSYILNGPGASGTQTVSSNIITIPNLASANTGVFTITSVGTCTAVGTTTISIAPATPLTVNASSVVCQNSGVTLSASMIGGTNFAWLNPLNTTMGTSGVSPLNVNITSAQPNDAGIYTATADLPWGGIFCTRTATTQVLVVATSPISTAASPANMLCQGDKLNFSAVAGGAVSWSWTGPQSFASNASNPVINPVQPTNTGTYNVTAFFTNNIITCSTTAAMTIQVIPITQPIITGPSSACQNATISLFATATGGSNFSWVGPNFSQANLAVATLTNVQTSASGVYYVTAKFGPGQLCSSTNSVQLTVLPVNTITVIPPTPVCQPSWGSLQASAIGASSYQWTGPSGFSAPGPNTYVYYPTPANSGIYTVTAYFTGSNLTCTNTATAQLMVNPVLNFSLVPRQQVCYNTPLSVSGPTGATTYSWTSSNGYVSTNKDINFPSVQPNNSGTYTLNVTLGPCVSSASTTIDVLTPVQFTLVPHDRTICRGDTTILEAGASGGSQNYAYVWNPSVYLDNLVGSKKTCVPLGTVIYNVIAHDISCPNYTISQSFSVNVLQPPIPNLILSKTGGCEPLSIYFDSKTDSTSAITTYDFGGIEKYQNDKFTHKFVNPGTYSVTVYTKGKNGCGNTYKVPYPIVVYPSPHSSIFYTPENPTTVDEVVFSSSYVNGPLTYKQWSFSGGLPSVIDTTIDLSVPGSDTSVAENPSRVYSSIGNYPVMLISKNEYECADTVFKLIPIIDDFRMYVPNSFTPNDDGVNDSFGVKASGMKAEGFTMELSDRWGNVLFFTRDPSDYWDGKYKGKVVMNGTYIYRIKAVGMNGEGRKEFIGHFNVLK